ncbi:MAG: hypothetical protein HLUCCX10_02150 [Algoriphagus marincola HL-49]|uniref:Uncharacterized protein n=1 Tax=Algoriphagus marincola HL-49 TaxID=1305737 RepID=A0A0P7YUY0_9BACT|nr:MAG: hypothetical protein HLUCCX10_02150 [Algoriphagus marincola HL-49]
MRTIEQIEKEQVSMINFAKQDVLSIKLRMADLHRSQTLGNLLQTKVRLTFRSIDEQVYEVHTTVWAVGSDFVVLKGGVTIPIRSILRVE